MPNYLYESIPGSEGEPLRYYEIQQRLSDKPLTVHPETGESIRKSIQAGAVVSGSSGAMPPPPCEGGRGPCACGLN